MFSVNICPISLYHFQIGKDFLDIQYVTVIEKNLKNSDHVFLKHSLSFECIIIFLYDSFCLHLLYPDLKVYCTSFRAEGPDPSDTGIFAKPDFSTLEIHFKPVKKISNVANFISRCVGIR